ncbi:MAG: hypothetical protein KF768_07590 [Phycisphaeraceae bacterium]|nr:hypothetical protein [Phycisphaeraceae bacterium]
MLKSVLAGSTSGTRAMRVWRWRGFAAAFVACAAVLAVGALSVPQALASNPDSRGKAGDAKSDQVELIFRSGNVVKGTLIEEDEGTIKVRVRVGTIEAETTYNKSDILAINRDLPAPTATGEKKAAPGRATAPGTSARAAGSGKPKVYVLELKGEFGRDVAATPFKEVMADVRKHQPDYFIMRFDLEPKTQGQEFSEVIASPDGLYKQGVAEKIFLELYDNLVRDPNLEKKPEIVAWVNRAIGGSAYLPFACPKIVFTSEGRHGGLGFLDRAFGYADEVVREKWRGAMMAGMKGMAIDGGHDPRLVEAMLRNDYVLSYKIEGGRVVYMERMPQGPNEFLLTDDGRGENADSMEDVARYRGNDSLMLNPDLALRLGVSMGTADNLSDVMTLLGVTGEFVEADGNGTKILERWSKDITDAEITFRRLFRDLNRVEVRAPGTWREENEAMGRQIQILQQVNSLLQRTRESINPREIQGAPENWMQQIDLTIDQLRNAIRRNRPR